MTEQKPFVILSLPSEPSLLGRPHSYSLDRSYESFMKLIKDISSSRLEVKVLCPSNMDIRLTYELWEFAERIRHDLPETEIPIHVEDREIAYGIRWARDIFQAYGNLVLCGRGFVDLTKDILIKSGVNTSDLVFRESLYGEGGNVVRSRNVLIVPDRLLEDPLYRELERMGFTIYTMPAQLQDPKNGNPRLFGHLDTELTYVSEPGFSTLLATELYYANFASEVDSLKAELGADLHVIEDTTENIAQKAANIIQLPISKLVVAKTTSGLIPYLEKVFGKDKILLSGLTQIDYNGPNGGIRCMSNVVDFLY